MINKLSDYYPVYVMIYRLNQDCTIQNVVKYIRRNKYRQCASNHTVRSPSREKDVGRESASSAVTTATGTKKWLEISTHTESWPNGTLSDSIG